MRDNTRARAALIAMIIGLAMIIGGMFYFMTKVRITSLFFAGGEGWPIWASFLCLIPLVVGIILMLALPRNWFPRILSIAGAVFVLGMIIYQTTLHLQTRLATYQWLIIGGTIGGGLAIVMITLFAKKKDRDEKR